MSPSNQVNVAPATGRRSRTWSTCSTASQSSITSIYARISQGSVLAEPQEGYANVYGSFTTTIPAALWLRNHLGVDVRVSGERVGGRCAVDCGYDTPPDSPLSFFQSLPGSEGSPSISRTLTDFDWGRSSVGAATFPPSPSVAPPVDDGDSGGKLHPILRAVEKGSKLSCRTVCSTCMKGGSNFPRCPRCEEMWCSRACRLRGGSKHVCAGRKM